MRVELKSVPEIIELTDEQRAELDRWLAAYAQNPDARIPWDEFKEKVVRSL